MIECETSASQRKAWTLVIAVVVCVLVAEISLQVRSHLTSGQSVWNYWTNQETFVRHPIIGLRTLRPNATIVGSGSVIVSNSLGLRSDEIPPEPAAGELRIAVLGASTVMGTFSRNNADTFPAQMQTKLRALLPGRTINVINAGVAGYNLREQRDLLEKVILPLTPTVLIVYPGGNDFTAYCDGPADVRKRSARSEARPLPKLTLPPWWMSGEMIKKNTVSLRPLPPSTEVKAERGGNEGHSAPAGPSRTRLDAELRRFDDEVLALVETARRIKLRLVFVGSAYAYRPDMQRSMLERLSATARYYAPCFDVDGLMSLQAERNARLRKVALTHGAEYLDMSEIVPGGRRYFGDAAHFTPRGEALAAAGLIDRLKLADSTAH